MLDADITYVSISKKVSLGRRFVSSTPGRRRVRNVSGRDAFSVLEEDGRIADVNQRACEQTGYAREELQSIPI